MLTLWKRVRRAAHELAGIWRYALARDELDALDDATLRDLGVRRSELASLIAESRGRCEPTRLRVLRAGER